MKSETFAFILQCAHTNVEIRATSLCPQQRLSLQVKWLITTLGGRREEVRNFRYRGPAGSFLSSTG